MTLLFMGSAASQRGEAFGKAALNEPYLGRTPRTGLTNPLRHINLCDCLPCRKRIMEEPLSPDQVITILRAANEGIPVAAISRIIKLPFGDVHQELKHAMASGQIVEIPKSDWPPTAKWGTRVPTVPRTYNTEDLEFYCRKVFKLTLLEAGFMTVLLRNDQVNKTRLHGVVEEQRQKRQQRPDLELTDQKIVDVIVCKLRKKLKLVDPEVVLTTSWGRGYYFEPAVKMKVFQMIGGIYASDPEARRGTDSFDVEFSGTDVNP